MKRSIIALLLPLSVFLASCSSTNDNAGGSDGGSPPTEQPINNPPSSPGTPPAPTPPDDTRLAVSLSSSTLEGEAPLKVVFTASANEQVSYEWFVDDRQIEVASDTLTYTFENAGSFAVTVSGTNTDGDVANASTTVTSTLPDPVNPTPPTNPIDPAPPETPTPPTNPVDPAPPEQPVPPENPAPPGTPTPPPPPEEPAPPPEEPTPPEEPAPPDVTPPPPGNPADFALEYRVESSCGVAFVTYHTTQQGMEEGTFGNGTVYLSNDVFAGLPVFIQGTNYCDSGKITVQVRKYGEVYRTATSSGKGTRATLVFNY